MQLFEYQVLPKETSERKSTVINHNIIQNYEA